MNKTVSVIGAGAWGTALALAFARGGCDVLLWGRDEARMAQMAASRQCGDVLPGIALEAGITPSSDLAAAARRPIVVMAIPTQNLRAVCLAMVGKVSPDVVMLCAAKGIEQQTGLFVTQVMYQCLSEDGVNPQAFGLLSGPSFATDVGKGLPTAISLAMRESEQAQEMARRLSSAGLRLYHTSDCRGVEIGGAAKNVLAIAAGIVAGMGLGESARAAMIARGFAELRRFASAFGANPETLMGLSGLGDLLLTASSTQSRNFSLGLGLGAGKSLSEAMGAQKTGGAKLAEGAFTASILAKMAHDRDVDMPIVQAVTRVIDGQISVMDAVRDLMARPLRCE